MRDEIQTKEDLEIRQIEQEVQQINYPAFCSARAQIHVQGANLQILYPCAVELGFWRWQ